MENIVLHLKLMRGMRRTLLTYVVRCHVKVAHVSSGYGAYLNLDEEMIVSAPIANAKSNLKMTQETLDRAYLNHQVDTFKIDNAMVYQNLFKVFMYMGAYDYMNWRKAMQDGQALYFNVNKYFLGPDHVARQAAEAEGKLQKLPL